MKKKEKMVILILLIITIILVTVGIVTKTNSDNSGKEIANNNEVEKEEYQEPIAVLDDGTRFNTSEKLHEEKSVDGIVLSDIQLTEKGNVTELIATATNTSSEAKGGYPVKVTSYDKDGNELVTINGYLGELQPGKSRQFYTSATFDFANAHDFKISK